MPHHITQRGNRGCEVFRSDRDRDRYLALLGRYGRKYGLALEAYCLMPNHVHLIAVPENAESLGLTLRDAHQAYATQLNQEMGEVGHLWQGRYFSCVLDESHFWAAVRYVERNPVRAGMVRSADEYRWSSAPHHCGLRDGALVAGKILGRESVRDWRGFLGGNDCREQVKELRQSTRTGRPWGSSAFLDRVGAMVGRDLHRGKRGPKLGSRRSPRKRPDRAAAGER